MPAVLPWHLSPSGLDALYLMFSYRLTAGSEIADRPYRFGSQGLPIGRPDQMHSYRFAQEFCVSRCSFSTRPASRFVHFTVIRPGAIHHGVRVRRPGHYLCIVLHFRFVLCGMYCRFMLAAWLTGCCPAMRRGATTNRQDLPRRLPASPRLHHHLRLRLARLRLARLRVPVCAAACVRVGGSL